MYGLQPSGGRASLGNPSHWEETPPQDTSSGASTVDLIAAAHPNPTSHPLHQSNQHPSLSLWTCEACNMTVPLVSKRRHLASTEHAQAQAPAASLSPPYTVDHPSLALWTCIDCGTKMPQVAKDRHMKSQDHVSTVVAAAIARLRINESNSNSKGNDTSPAENRYLDTTFWMMTPGSPTGSIQSKWACQTCGRTHFGGEEAHQKSARNNTVLQVLSDAKGKDKRETVAFDADWSDSESDFGSGPMDSYSIAWNGVVIPNVVIGSSRGRPRAEDAHPNGHRRIPIRDVRKVYDHPFELPAEAYNRVLGRLRRDGDLGGGMVSALDVYRAEEDWDVHVVKRNIDTQWGMMPRGGAYKESDEYYGQGVYDFY